MSRVQIVLFMLAMPSFALAAPPAQTTLKEAKVVLDELEEVPEKGIPQALLNDAEAIVIIPNTVKAGFAVGGRVGHGVAVIKDKDGVWSEIRFLTLGGASVGFQIGVEVSDVVLVFKNRKGLDRILDGKNKLTLGGDASVAAGPVGRKASVSTDGALKSEIWSYSRSRGLFAGVALDGAVLIADTDKNDTFAKDDKKEVLKAVDDLKLRIATMLVDKAPSTTVEKASTLTTVPAPVPIEPVEKEKIRFPLMKKIFKK
jgi:lipid-binding SYLF domain-containing protein